MLNIQVVGPGCANCNKLEQLCREVVAENGLEAQVEKISDYRKIVELGILLTPALILNGKMVSSGKLPSRNTLLQWFTEQS
ncbi:MAG: TM0996/MTH895 family glutaredoxin-like protein [Calditrichaeota bacterium]|nr:TM0996/MTH895 family glutaredoxin-like protein [Calditrichota bacterium]